MSDPIVTLDDFATYLNNQNAADDSRAQMILDLAHELCESIVTPLPTTARSVVLDVAERGYANPTSVRNSGLGLYAEGEGPFSEGTPGAAAGGMWLTQENRATLRRMSGGGGAFTIDTTPATAGQGLPAWDSGTWWPA